jgi:lysophospholipase L1-like esterase
VVPARALTAAKLALAPLLLWQAVRARQRALDLPEPSGARRGRVQPAQARSRSPLRLLVVGDSSAAGVGVAHQHDALAHQLAYTLAEETGRPVHWQLLAHTGHTTGEALQHLRDTRRLQPADILVTALGVNDVVRQVPVQRCLEQLLALHADAQARTGVRYWLHSGLPPMHQFPLLPPPLRWVLGAQAEGLNQRLHAELGDQIDRSLMRVPTRLRCDAGSGLMAADGFHPSAQGYALWGEALGQYLARRWSRLARREALQRTA